MRKMKKIALGFMTLLMLTPVLVCAMAFCPMQAAQVAGEPPCHGMDNAGGLMLALDCMGVDLFLQDTSSDISFNDSVDHIDDGWVELVLSLNFQSDDIHAIRGPPDRARRGNIAPPVILTTQRFRI